MKRPLLILFFVTILAIYILYPHTYRPDPVFTQGQHYPVTVSGQLKTYTRQTNGVSLTLTDCQIFYHQQVYSCSQLLVTMDESNTISLQAGNQLQVKGELSSFSPARNPGNFDWYSYYRSRHLSYRVYADHVIISDPHIDPLRHPLLLLRESLTQRLHQLCGSDTKTAALLTALLLGDKTLLEEDTKNQYEAAGILHILTVSGLHVSLLGSTVILLGKKLFLPPWLRNLLSSLLILLYWQLCGAGMSAGRAVIMFLCLTAAPLMERSYDSLSALSLAGILILLTSPDMLFQAGFQLSFGAILGIHLASSSRLPYKETAKTTNNSTSISYRIFFKTRSLIHRSFSSLHFSLGLQLTLLPITLYHFFRYPLYGSLLNLLLLPLATPLFLLGATALFLAELLPILGHFATPWGIPLYQWLLLPCQWILRGYDLLCQWALSLPHASVLSGRPETWRILIYYCVLGFGCFGAQRHSAQPMSQEKKKLYPVLLPSVILALTVLFIPLPRRSLSVTFLDVGQGDCTFIETPEGTTVLIDSGSSDIRQMADYRLIPFLESQGIDHLDYVFLSHTDEDHLNGITDWLESGCTIGTAILPVLPETLSSKPSYLQAIHMLSSYQIPIHYFSQGMLWQEGDLSLTCLVPVDPSDDQASLYQSLNAASQVLLLQYQGIRILFSGDCEKEGETLLLHYLQKKDITCHILKAGHHGSNYATTQELLDQLQPQAVIVSCGVRNRYGHPHPAMLDRVESIGATCHVTAGCGAVSMKISHGKISIKTFLPTGPIYYR